VSQRACLKERAAKITFALKKASPEKKFHKKIRDCLTLKAVPVEADAEPEEFPAAQPGSS
jgi:hypothetical protein